MQRLLAHAYRTPTGAEKSRCVDLAVGLMRVTTPLGERAARLPAGPSNPQLNAGVTFTTLRDTSALPAGPGAWPFFNEWLSDFPAASAKMATAGDARASAAARALADLAARAAHGAGLAAATKPAAAPASPASPAVETPETSTAAGIETATGSTLTLIFETKRCIHARHCVTGAPNVFLASVKGPWLYPDAMDAERLADIAHACPSGAIRYRRNDGRPNEAPPPVNLAAVREAGPYAFRGELVLDGAPAGTRASLCRCGASKNKPLCDNSHLEVGFDASGNTAALALRDGPLQIDPQLDGPLQVRGSLEITSGTGRVVARTSSVRLCRCGASASKPLCDSSHWRVGFRST